MPGEVLDLPFDQLGTMWDLRQLVYANIEEEHRWLAAEAFFGISAFLLQRQNFNEKLLEVARWSRQLVPR